MPQLITEGSLQFSFPDGKTVSKYDDWVCYRKFSNAINGTKAVDIVHVDINKIVWLIEIKDYRVNRRTKPSELSDEIALKVRDTLAGLAVARFQAQVSVEKQVARKVLQARQLRVVLHLEQIKKPSKLFPQSVDLADIHQQLKRLLKAIDAHPCVVDQNTLKSTMLWTVADI